MATTTFSDSTGTPIVASWLNDVNDAVYHQNLGVLGSVDRLLESKNADIISAKDFGAIGDNSTDDASALNTAAAYCTTNQKVLYIPAGTYRTASTIIFENCHVSALGAEIRPDATVTYGVNIGSPSVICDGKTIHGLKVRGAGWTAHPAGAAAWNFVNVNQCVFDSIVGNRMEKGARVSPPSGARVAYTEWRNPYFHRCNRNFDIYLDTANGYAAGNTVYGGRFQLTSTETAEAHVYAEKTASASGSMNDWQWICCRMESYTGATVPRWAMRMLRADYWHIIDPRTEGDWADADFEFSANSTNNEIDMLYDKPTTTTIIDANGTNVVRWQRNESIGGGDTSDPASSCIRRFYRNATARIQVLSDGTALPGVSLGSLASESAVEMVWVPSSSSVGFRVDGTLIAEADSDSWRPATNGTINLGEASRKWNTVYAATGTINTSDEREKQDIEAIPDAVLDAWADVEFVAYRWRSAVEEKKNDARIHFGVIAQRVKKVFEDHGLDPFAYGILCWDKWDEEAAIVEENGFISRPLIEAGDRYGIRYEEALALECALLRRSINRLEKKNG